MRMMNLIQDSHLDNYRKSRRLDNDTKIFCINFFSAGQASMARVVCDNTNVEEIQPMVFR